jgi:hypothetical protein
MNHWNIEMLEGWNIESRRLAAPSFHFSIIPFFHHST